MSKLTQKEEKELIAFIKDWLKFHGLNQKDLANEFNLRSSRTSEIIKKLKDFYRKGGMFNIAKNLIKIEQDILNNNKNHIPDKSETSSYNQLDIDSLVSQITKDTRE